MYFPAITKSINKLIKRLISIHTNSQGKKINIYAEYDNQLVALITLIEVINRDENKPIL